MLTTTLTSTPMEIDTPSSNSRSPSPAKHSPSSRSHSKQKLSQWKCQDLTVVHKRKGNVKLANHRFLHDESCDDSM